MSKPNSGGRRFLLRRHLNKLRWLSLAVVFAMLVLLPFLHVYQTYVAAHGYDLLSPDEKLLYDVMEAITSPFVKEPAEALDAIKGNTWSGTIWGFKMSDPLAVVGQIAAGHGVHWPFVVTVAVPLLATLLLGRFFCGWICPATFIYELTSNFAALLKWAGIDVGRRRLDRRLKYGVLAFGLIASAASGSILVAAVYPPAIIGRELYYAIAWGGLGAGAAFFAATLLFDLLVARRGFCRYLCPGGALYSLLGRYRAVRLRRTVETCNDCAKCNGVCEFGLDPMRDGFGQECNNCTACVAVCPTDALVFTIKVVDVAPQGPGHLGRRYRHGEASAAPSPAIEAKEAAA
ncbi:MAG: 4Fe-4S binding protein [Rhodocyclaceae bacterium]|nr:4Fe-4S binding protein [Rhodocyclaceae bacterium]